MFGEQEKTVRMAKANMPDNKHMIIQRPVYRLDFDE